MLKLKHVLIILICFFTSTLAIAETIKISQQQLMNLINEPSSSKFIILDVRTKKEFDQGHIKGALNISHDTITDNLASLAAHKDKTVIVYCRSGRRAAVAEDILLNVGFKKLKHLDGDMNAWIKEYLPIVSNN